MQRTAVSCSEWPSCSSSDCSFNLQSVVHHVLSWCAGDGVQRTYRMGGSRSYEGHDRGQFSGLRHRSSFASLQGRVCCQFRGSVCFANTPPPLDAESELRQLRETVAQLKGQVVKPAATSEGPASKRVCRREISSPPAWKSWQGGQTRSRGSATSCARQHNSGNEKFLLEVCHPW